MTRQEMEVLLAAILQANEKEIILPEVGQKKTVAPEYQFNISKFVKDVLGADPRPTQKRILDLLIEHQRVCVRSPRGYGKTALAAWVVLWAISVFPKVKVITTAGAWSQLTNGLWKEIPNWSEEADWSKIGIDVRPDKELTKHRLEISSNRFAFAVAPKDPAKIEGVHSDVVVCIIDEGKVVPNDIWDAIEGSFTGSRKYYFLAISTPGVSMGRFYEIHMRRPGLEDWHPVHVTGEMALAEKVPGFKEQMDKRAEQWGKESPFFKQQFMAEFAQDEESALIPMSFVEDAVERWYKQADILNTDRTLEIIGMDVGGTGASSTVLAKLYDGTYISLLEEHKNPDTGDNIEILKKALAPSYSKDSGKFLATANVDVIGIGVGVVDGFHNDDGKRYTINGVNVSKPTKKKDKLRQFGFNNLRSYIYWRLRERLDASRTPEEELLCLPPDDDLIGELTNIRYEMRSGNYKIESKDAIKRRLGKSPDKADAISLLMFDDFQLANVQIMEGDNPFFQ